MIRIGIGFIFSLLMAGYFEALADERSLGANSPQVTVRLLEYRFEPAQITLQAGKEVELILVNEGTVMHEFITDALKGLEVDVEINGVVAETQGVAELEVPPKGKVILRLIPEKPGEFAIACKAVKPKNHFKEGMHGKLIIEKTAPGG